MCPEFLFLELVDCIPLLKFMTSYLDSNSRWYVSYVWWRGQPHVFVCLFVCLFACLFVCLFVSSCFNEPGKHADPIAPRNLDTGTISAGNEAKGSSDSGELPEVSVLGM